MSFEQVLLLVALVVVPLIEFLMRLARQRSEPEPVQGQSAPAPARQRTMPEVKATPKPLPALEEALAVVPPASRKTRRGTVAVGLRNGPELRRAIVWMTVIEPCRAVHPYD